MLFALSPAVTAALVAGAVSLGGAIIGASWLDRRAHKVDLATDHKHEQRKALLALIARYHGRLLEHATSWNYRMGNLFANVGENWLRLDGAYASPHYYFDSTVYRFFALLSLAQKFESEEIFIDARYVEARELEFVKFTKAFQWVMSDVDLFAGLEYGLKPVDHFYSDRLRAMCEAFSNEEDVPTFREFEVRLRASDTSELVPVFQYFDGLTPDEQRFRWDRLVCLHILTTAFVATFGYEWQRPTGQFITLAAGEIRHEQVLSNLVRWLPTLGLDRQTCLQELQQRK